MKEAFLIGCYPNTPAKLEVTLNLIDDMRQFDIPIVVSSHHVIPESIQSKVDFVIFDKNNPMDDRVKLIQYYTLGNYLTIWGPWEENYHAAAGQSAIQHGADFCKGKFDQVYFQDYDVSLNLDLYIHKVRELNKPFVFFNWLGDVNSVATNVYAFQTKYFQDLWKFPVYTCDDYLANVQYAADITGVWNLIIEGLGLRLLRASKLDYHIFMEEEKENLIKSYSLCDAPSNHLTAKVWLGFASNHKIMLFIINHSNVKLPVIIKSKYFNFEYVASPFSGNPILSIDIRWWLLEREGIIEVQMGDAIKKTYDLDAGNVINEINFQFKDGRDVVQEF